MKSYENDITVIKTLTKLSSSRNGRYEKLVNLISTKGDCKALDIRTYDKHNNKRAQGVTIYDGELDKFLDAVNQYMDEREKEN